MTRVGLIGDYDATVPAHRAIPIALGLAGDEVSVSVEYEWIPTDEILDTLRVIDFNGLWCVPASPYRSVEGALIAIRFARENQRPFLGTCGGFQHVIIERSGPGFLNRQDEWTRGLPGDLPSIGNRLATPYVRSYKSTGL